MNYNIITSGKRKTAIVRIYVKPGNGKIIANGKDYKEYFNSIILQNIVRESLLITKTENIFDINAKLKGGGTKCQAEAFRLAISRALIKKNHDFRSDLKKYNLLTRDSRIVERKKYGYKKARKQFQFSKR
ncbi:MAG: 30S ribosomal protein S9 [Bacteroides sp.]|nr:MAG: 30S ribosomal protein S9 [Bacteroides sp.]